MTSTVTNTVTHGTRAYAVSVLGRFSVDGDGVAVRLSPVESRLVVLLAVAGPRTRADAAGALWPDLAQERAGANLRTALWRLRRLGPALVVEGGAMLELSARVDYHEVTAWADTVFTCPTMLDALPEGAVRELLPGWGEAWLVEPREHLRQLQLHALEAEAQHFFSLGNLGRAFSRAQAAVSIDPFRESSTRLLIEILLHEGNAVEAIRRYRRYRALLAAELGTPPGHALTSLVAPFLAPAQPNPRPVSPRVRL